jgi:hypothetical protein
VGKSEKNVASSFVVQEHRRPEICWSTFLYNSYRIVYLSSSLFVILFSLFNRNLCQFLLSFVLKRFVPTQMDYILQRCFQWKMLHGWGTMCISYVYEVMALFPKTYVGIYVEWFDSLSLSLIFSIVSSIYIFLSSLDISLSWTGESLYSLLWSAVLTLLQS